MSRPRTQGRTSVPVWSPLAIVDRGAFDRIAAEHDRASGLDDDTIAESRFREEQERRDRIEDMGAGRWAA